MLLVAWPLQKFDLYLVFPLCVISMDLILRSLHTTRLNRTGISKLPHSSKQRKGVVAQSCNKCLGFAQVFYCTSFFWPIFIGWCSVIIWILYVWSSLCLLSLCRKHCRSLNQPVLFLLHLAFFPSTSFVSMQCAMWLWCIFRFSAMWLWYTVIMLPSN